LLKGSWKTTLSGLFTIALAIGILTYMFVTKTATPLTVGITLPFFSQGIGLINAKDNNVTGGSKPNEYTSVVGVLTSIGNFLKKFGLK
jgi:hypothetical protein